MSITIRVLIFLGINFRESPFESRTDNIYMVWSGLLNLILALIFFSF